MPVPTRMDANMSITYLGRLNAKQNSSLIKSIPPGLIRIVLQIKHMVTFDFHMNPHRVFNHECSLKTWGQYYIYTMHVKNGLVAIHCVLLNILCKKISRKSSYLKWIWGYLNYISYIGNSKLNYFSHKFEQKYITIRIFCRFSFLLCRHCSLDPYPSHEIKLDVLIGGQYFSR